MKINRRKLRKLILNEMRYLFEGNLPDDQMQVLQLKATNAIRNPKSEGAKELIQLLDGMKSSAPGFYKEAMAVEEIKKGYEAALKAAGKKLESSKISPGKLRKMLRSKGISSGVTSYAQDQTTGDKGLLIFGLSEEDLVKIRKIAGRLGLKEFKGRAAIKTFKFAKGSATAKGIADDKPFMADDPNGYLKFRKFHRGSVFLY